MTGFVLVAEKYEGKTYQRWGFRQRHASFLGAGEQRRQGVWLPSVSVSIHQRNGLGKPLNAQRAPARGFG